MNPTILIIDDEERIRKSFRLILEDEGFQVDTAETGDQGMILAARGQYNLILLDLKMPGKDGVQILRELRRIDANVPVYIVTAFHQEFFHALNIARQEGMDFDLLRKPISAADLVAAVKGAHSGAQAY